MTSHTHPEYPGVPAEIIDEGYLVQSCTTDATMGELCKPTWVPKHKCDPELIMKWRNIEGRKAQTEDTRLDTGRSNTVACHNSQQSLDSPHFAGVHPDRARAIIKDEPRESGTSATLFQLYIVIMIALGTVPLGNDGPEVLQAEPAPMKLTGTNHIPLGKRRWGASENSVKAEQVESATIIPKSEPDVPAWQNYSGPCKRQRSDEYAFRDTITGFDDWPSNGHVVCTIFYQRRTVLSESIHLGN